MVETQKQKRKLQLAEIVLSNGHINEAMQEFKERGFMILKTKEIEDFVIYSSPEHFEKYRINVPTSNIPEWASSYVTHILEPEEIIIRKKY